MPKNQYHCIMGRKKWTIAGLAFLVILLSLFFINRNKRLGNEEGEREAMAKLGRYLFFDNRLSFNRSKSCASCHDPRFAFTDEYRRSITASGDELKHNAPSLLNISLQNYFDWASPLTTTLEIQHQRPLFNEHPVEMGFKTNEQNILKTLKKDSLYQRLFFQAFPRSKDPFRAAHIISCLASFVRTLHSFRSPYDRYTDGDSAALTLPAKAGMALFFSASLNCSSCHPAPLFTVAGNTKNPDSIYFNTGLYNVSQFGRYPDGDNGLAAISGKASDDGKFKTPSLRNVAMTAPYMHDGSVNSLEEVLDIYARGGRNIIIGPAAGDGKDNPHKDHRITGFLLSSFQKNQLLSFLYSLSDSIALSDPAFQNPFDLINK